MPLLLDIHGAFSCKFNKRGIKDNVYPQNSYIKTKHLLPCIDKYQLLHNSSTTNIISHQIILSFSKCYSNLNYPYCPGSIKKIILINSGLMEENSFEKIKNVYVMQIILDPQETHSNYKRITNSIS